MLLPSILRLICSEQQVMGEELGVLPEMDTIVSALELERLVGFLKNKNQKSNPKDKFDIVVYDGISTEETIRMIGATGKSRLIVFLIVVERSLMILLLTQ